MENNEKPIIYALHPQKMEMEPGTYFWCACGRSKNQPFCDGSHKGTSFLPEKVVIEERRIVPWCLCRHSEKGAICDAKHRQLPGYKPPENK